MEFHCAEVRKRRLSESVKQFSMANETLRFFDLWAGDTTLARLQTQAHAQHTSKQSVAGPAQKQ